MTPEQAKRLLPVITAFANGQTIQATLNDHYPWQDVKDPHFDAPLMWRINPTAKYRPWTQDEVPVGKVCVACAYRTLISAVSAGHTYLNGASFKSHEMLEQFTMDDGSPCGVLES